GLPLSEIPVFNPEFDSPLFLLLYCQSRQKRIRKKPERESFRGHEGFSSVFEDFTEYLLDNIVTELGIGASQIKGIWNKIIKGFASEMVHSRNYKDRISSHKAKKIAKDNLPSSVDPSQFLSALEHHHLIIKMPRFGNNGNVSGYDYRFSYQRFSDHLITRYLLNQYPQKDGTQRLSRALSKKGAIGKHLLEYEYKGLIEALSIEIPERYGGTELMSLCPWARSFIKNEFLTSIIWRNPKAFNFGKVRDLINKEIIPYEEEYQQFILTILNVASIPKHPFNADLLHQYLFKLRMPKRDGTWSVFVGRDYRDKDDGPIARIFHWIFSILPQVNISYEQKRLLAIVITWLLTTSNRAVRDRSTRALLTLLDQSADLILEVNMLFQDVDDPYVVERLFATTYGALLRSPTMNDPNLKDLGDIVYKKVFLKPNSFTSHILIRDYAKSIIELLVTRNIYTVPSGKKITSTCGLKWPSRIPSLGVLRKRFYPSQFNWEKSPLQERGVMSIWNSLDGGIPDFYNYIIKPAIRHWSKYRIGATLPLSAPQIEKKFISTLSRHQYRIYKKLTSIPPTINITFTSDETPMLKELGIDIEGQNDRRQEYIKYYQKFINTLDREQNTDYKLLSSLTRKKVSGWQWFDPEIAKRWILSQTFKYYNKSLHGSFDGALKSFSRDYRQVNILERLGKKYEWISFHQLLGLLADNYHFSEYSYQQEESQYKGAWQVGIRDIDPTCILASKPIPTINIFSKPPTRLVPNPKWIRLISDLPDPKILLSLTDQSNKEWYLLHSYFSWRDKLDEETSKKEITYFMHAFITPRAGSVAFARKLNTYPIQSDWNSYLQTSRLYEDCFLREYPYSSVYESVYSDEAQGISPWIKDFGERHKLPCPVVKTAFEYSSSLASRDNSTDENFSIFIPSPGIIKLLGLSHSTKDGLWADSNGDIVCTDLSVTKCGPSSLAINKSTLLAYLVEKDLAVVWSFYGEKMLLSNTSNAIGEFIGSYILTGDGIISGKFHRVKRSD
ncbi:hypothetical protein IT418_03250, partial [bacterium]|nr:hypothetical protein [bacterium]